MSGGLIALIITIVVLEMKVPHGERLDAQPPLVPVFLTYVPSFVYVGSYWNHHHHMRHTCYTVTGPIETPLDPPSTMPVEAASSCVSLARSPG